MNLFFLILSLAVQSVNAWAVYPLEERTLVAYLKVLPGKEQLFLHHAQTVIEATRREPGNLIYVLHQSVTNPQQFVFYELFRTANDLQIHRNAPHVKDFLRTVEPLLVPGQFTLEEYTPTDLGRVPQAQRGRPRAGSPSGLLHSCHSSRDQVSGCFGKLEGDDCGSGPSAGICSVFQNSCSCEGY